ncbi:MAG: dihydroneopterin aldolase [Campylobacteraceae bacterium]|nr:dihydroneopterin aldolase [Campylobacteraceae bacterium]
MKVLIEDLTFKCIIGLLKKERTTPQKVILDLELHVKDEEFLDYSKVVKILKKTYKKEKFFKLEDSLLHVEKILKKKFPKISYMYIKIIKPDILPKCRVGVALEKKY